MSLGHVLLPALGIMAQLLVVLTQTAKELLPLQGVDCCVQHLDDRGLLGLGKGLEALGVWAANTNSGGVCRSHNYIVDEM